MIYLSAGCADKNTTRLIIRPCTIQDILLSELARGPEDFISKFADLILVSAFTSPQSGIAGTGVFIMLRITDPAVSAEVLLPTSGWDDPNAESNSLGSI